MGQYSKRSEFPVSPAVGDLIYRSQIVYGGSQYPTAHNDTYVKATSSLNADEYPYFATDPAKSLTGAVAQNSWASNGTTNQRFHIDLGSAKIITRIYYENWQNSGGTDSRGARNFTFWGSNTAAAFAELTYGTDTNWTQLTTSRSSFEAHAEADIVDPKYITVTNTTAYRYYAFKIADNYGGTTLIGLRRISLQIPSDTPPRWSKLPIGTSGQTLKVAASGIPAWTT